MNLATANRVIERLIHADTRALQAASALEDAADQLMAALPYVEPSEADRIRRLVGELRLTAKGVRAALPPATAQAVKVVTSLIDGD